MRFGLACALLPGRKACRARRAAFVPLAIRIGALGKQIFDHGRCKCQKRSHPVLVDAIHVHPGLDKFLHGGQIALQAGADELG